MKNIALATVYSKINYGTVLQAFATQKVLDELGYTNFTIDCSSIDKNLKAKKNKYFLTHIFEKDMLKSKIGFFTKKVRFRFDKRLKNNEILRKKKFEEFVFDNIRFSPVFENISSLSEYIEDNVDVVIVGSDQIWLPQHIVAGYYTLEWVPKGVKRVSLSTSFGKNYISKRIGNDASRFLEKFDYISTRENSGKDIIKDLCGRDSNVLCDPTMMLKESDWKELVSDEKILNEKYIFCYFLGKNSEHRKFAKKIKNETGYKIVALIHMDEYVAEDEKYADYAPYDIGPREFLNCIFNAEIVLTDSFHGTVFSILFKKNFLTFKRFSNNSSMSTNDRIYTLLNRVGLEDRLCCSFDYHRYNDPIDYRKVDIIIEEMRNDAKEFISDSLGENEKIRNIFSLMKKDCVGCSACMNVCPARCITMKYDSEGFLYPYVDEKKCIGCNACVNLCPSKNKKRNGETNQRAFLVQNKDNDVRKLSTSGGLFSAIASYVINRGGVVFGAAYVDGTLHVEHIGIKNNDDIPLLRGSKYVQSDSSKAYKEINSLLDENIEVCYVGTPCQIEGLLSVVGNKRKNLYLIDVVCRGVPSPGVWESYVADMTKENKSSAKSASFRDKGMYGYRYSQMSISFGEGKKFLGGVDNNQFLRSFFGNTNVRPSCFCCKFRSRYRKSDITMWDCLDIADFNNQMDKNGTTRVLVHTEKGQSIIDNILDEINIIEIQPELAVKGVEEMIDNKIVNSNRKVFFEIFKKHNGVKSAFDECYPTSFKIRLEHMIRVLGAKTGAYYYIKKMVRAVWRKNG